MTTQVADLIRLTEQTRKELNSVTSVQLHSQKRRDSLRKLVEEYFNTIRPGLIVPSEQNQDVAYVDSLMQKLLVLCHKRGGVQNYKNLLSKIRKGLIILDARLVASPIAGESFVPEKVDALIISTLDQLVPSSALSYKQALQDLQSDHRFSWRGPATDLREALREILDYLAPDSDVISMPGYKQQSDTNGPTMKQKVRFIMKSRGVSRKRSEPTEAAAELVESAIGSFVRSVYTRSNVSTHTPTDKTEVIRVRDFVRVVLCELLELQA
jgi:hypothetical protein